MERQHAVRIESALDAFHDGPGLLIFPAPHEKKQQELRERTALPGVSGGMEQLQRPLDEAPEQRMARLTVDDRSGSSEHAGFHRRGKAVGAGVHQGFQLADPFVRRLELVRFRVVSLEHGGAGEQASLGVAAGLEARVGALENIAPLRRIGCDTGHAAPIKEPLRCFGPRLRNRRDPRLQGGVPALREQATRLLADQALQAGPIAGLAVKLRRFCDLSVRFQQLGRAPSEFG